MSKRERESAILHQSNLCVSVCVCRLRGFQMHLGDISSEIRKLQHDSLSMNVKLRNRKVLLLAISRAPRCCSVNLVCRLSRVSYRSLLMAWPSAKTWFGRFELGCCPSFIS